MQGLFSNIRYGQLVSSMLIRSRIISRNVCNRVACIPGAILATLSLALLDVMIITDISKFLQQYRQNKTLNDVFSTLRPAVACLIAAAGYSISFNAVGAVLGLHDSLQSRRADVCPLFCFNPLD